MEERLLPRRVAQVHVDRRVAGRPGRVECLPDVADLEGEVMRAGAVAVEEAAQEVVALHLGGLEHLEAHPVAERELGPVEPVAGARCVPGATEIADIQGPRVGVVLDGHRDVVEVGAADHLPMTSAKRSRCSRTIRPVEK